METIFKPYLNFTFRSRDFIESICRSETNIVSLIQKSFKGYENYLTIHDTRTTLQKICKLDSSRFIDKISMMNYVSWLLFDLGSVKIFSDELRTSFRKNLYEETMKIQSMSNKNWPEWESKM